MKKNAKKIDKNEELKDLKKKLFYKKENVYDVRTKKGAKETERYAKGYMKFLDNAKTEREAVREGIKMLEANGFVPYTLGGEIVAGGKYYYNNRDKSLFAFVAGTENIENGIRICAAHIDSPRLDLKQHPMFENEGFAYLKTHYYGGIRKYQWVTIPLALHGVVTTMDGQNVEIVIGEDEGDPIFCITDLLPHLAREQSQKPLGTAITGEGLNLLIGSEPIDGDIDEKVKFNMLKILNEKYGITENDFVSAELTATPAGKARDLGLDRSMIGAYGHDDRVCAYPSLTAIIENKDSEHTIMCVLADKEEIGSEGVSGMRCRLIVDLIDEISKNLGGNPNVVRANSMCLSADVSAGYDPMYPEVYEKRNSAIVNCGVVMNKYTGGGGKSSTNDASAEYVGKIRKIFQDAKITWQTAELGKIDVGGGGTVAMYIANHNINTVDLGVPVLSMHAPMEVISKNDLYETHRALCAFCK
ncbi:MAG: aminopeptidase [Ruminococcaceae bacterium]|nr:aminopeptidase [Oscillospiraceae bacterium]